MTVIGITGPYASGKSTIAAEYQSRGWHHIEVDHLGHEALKNRREELVERFSDDILSGGEVDRRRLGARVFSDPRALEQLEAIVHPEMRRRCAELIGEYKQRMPEGPGVLINAAILFKMNLHPLCDFILWIDAPRLTRAFRARKRDKLPWSEVFKRIRTQNELKTQLAPQNVDMYTVDNRRKAEALRRIDEILQVRVWNRIRPTSSSS